MKIVVDDKIPYIRETICQLADEVVFLSGAAITADDVKDADVLVVRTRTRCNQQLLEGSKVQLVVTATIGYDHIDTDYCRQHNIAFTSCPGCNAQAVCDYIEECLRHLNLPTSAIIGIVGVGHVGSLVAKMAERKGYHVILNDPPKNIGKSIDEIAQKCDFITFHTPLTTDGPYPTYHLCNEHFLQCCKPDAVIVNAARGGVVDEAALLTSTHPFIIDTWENEPHINTEVLQHAFRASMHIAGYSVEGKRNASQACLDTIAQTFSLPPVTLSPVKSNGDTASGWLERITHQLQAAPETFESLRKNYPLR